MHPRNLANLPTRTALAALLALGLPAIGCGERHGPADAEDSRTAVPVRVEVVAADDAGGALVLPARLKAREEATLTARLAGRVTALPAREGARVQAGAVLAVFDAPEARQALGAARSEFDAAALAAQIARRQQARMETLYVARVVADRDRELAASGRQSAEARLETARAALDQMQAATRVRAPFAGVVVRRHVDVGADVGAGTPIVDMRSEGGIEIVAPIPETAVPALEHATLAFQAGDGPWRRARLTRLEGMTDFVSRTRTARLVPMDPGPALEAGAYARVRLADAGPAPGVAFAEASRVPAGAIVRRGGLAGVYVVQAGRARLRWLQLGLTAGDRVEVLAGLFPGDSVIVRPDSLTDGRRVAAGRR